jgi:putative mRNA 3-end processing factor
MRFEDLLCPTPQGLYCPPGGFHIDPLRPVARALITHGHSDHARAGHGAVLATAETIDIMRMRYGDDCAGRFQAVRYGETFDLDGVRVTFHPAGHILGSAQICVERSGMRIVASGDYKIAADPTCPPFEPIACDVFITEATFGLPVFRWNIAAAETQKLIHSVALFPERAHLVGGYPLGKTQRMIALLRAAGHDRTIYLHGAMETMTRYYERRGVALGPLKLARDAQKAELAGSITVCPPSAIQDRWTRRFPDPVSAFVSGWMRVRARARQRGVELPLVISDHADWDGLTQAIRATGASEVWVTHGEEDALVHWCETQGLRARPLRLVGYGEEEEGDAVDSSPSPAWGGSAREARRGGVTGAGISDIGATGPTPDPSPQGGGEKSVGAVKA